MQSYGFNKDILKLEPLRKKFESFGFKVLEIDGHSRKDIYLSLKKAMNYKLKPTILICIQLKVRESSLWRITLVGITSPKLIMRN